ncbi:MAG: MBL fold metallo-hydrolase [Patescibacteria group bacterium]
MKITFCGANQEVTGSCHLVETGSTKFIVDCGMFQGRKMADDKNHENFPFDPKELDFALLTHAHIDHSGRLPKLGNLGFKGKIYGTHATCDFAKILLADSAHVIQMEAKRYKKPVLYEEKDAQKINTQFEGINYNQKIKINDEVEIQFRDAGHILGSAIIEVWAEGKKIVFSGDLGNPPVPILNPTEYIKDADYLLIESTYGNRVHEDSRSRQLLLASAIYEVATMKGVLMIPAFAMERTQEILYELNTLVENKDIPPIPIYIDSPLAIRALKIFKRHESLFNIEATSLIDSGDDIFNFPRLKLTEPTQESKDILNTPNPKIIIAGSGMCHGGRIMHHLKNYLHLPNSQVLIVGYQVNGSLGRQLLDKEKQVKIHEKKINVNAKVRAIGGYSAHADQDKLLNWLSHFDKTKLKNVFIVHGEEEQSRILGQLIDAKLKIPNSIPSQSDSIEL